jgi:cell pole-organizing protein PopZ
MTKPQFASEPSMEDILASIRKMISDDRSGPRPLPDQMTRTPFPDATAPAETSGRWENRADTASTQAARPGSSHGSLSEAIKAAAQPRTLEERISDLLEKGVAASAEPLASLGSRTRPAATPEPAAPSRTAAPAEPSAGSSAGAALPFGTRASAPDRSQPSSVASPTSVAPAKAAPSAPEPKADAQRVIAMPSRYSAPPAAGSSGSATNGTTLNGQVHGAAGSFGSRGATQPVRPTPTVSEDVARTKEQDHSFVARADARGAHISQPASAEVVKAALSEAPLTPAPAGPSEELVDAMVELVRREPSSLSVFTSGAAFIGGVSEKGVGVEKSVAAHKKGQSTVPAPQASQADDSVPELDGAAAELLRPMLRQWLAENMPRIVEAALRSEITSGGKGPGNA